MMNYFWEIVVTIFASSAFVYGYNEERIFNGEITPPDLFKFVVYAGCTASVISKRHLLNAAHCMYDKDKMTKYERYQVKTGLESVQIRNGSEKIIFKTDPLTPNIFMPILWPSDGSDIAVIEFPEGTDFGIEPVKLAKNYIEKEGDEVYIAGFGYWWQDGNEISGESEFLRHVKISIVKDCYGHLLVCAGNFTHRALPGDSGGPMLIKRNNQWYQIGVSALTGIFDYRTRVSSYCNFIEEVTKNEAKCESIYPERNIKNQMPLKIFEPIYKGESTPSELFNFIVPLYIFYYHRGCTATVISKRHLLTTASCVFEAGFTNENKNIQIAEHSTYNTVYGKLFPDFRSKNVHSNLLNPINVTAYFPSNFDFPWKNNIAVVEFPEGTDFGVERVSLPNDYTQTYLDNSTYISAGYGMRSINDDILTKESPPKLQHSRIFFFNDSYTDKHIENPIEELLQDEGGPTLIERNGKFYQIGVHIRYESRTFIPHYCSFIEEVTKNEVKCESIAPIHETPPESTTTTSIPQNQDRASSNPMVAQQLSNTNASMNEFEIVLFLIGVLTKLGIKRAFGPQASILNYRTMF